MAPVPYRVQHPYSSLRPESLKPFLRPLFIETGTNVGHGIATALEAGFPRVISIEADPQMFAIAQKRFQADFRVTCLLGSSPDILMDLMRRQTKSATIFLDAHSTEANPLLEELAAIATSPCKTHILMIDDVRMFGSDLWHGLSQSQIEKAVFKINPFYRLSFIDTTNDPRDLLVAQL